MIKDGRSGRKFVLLLSDLEENLYELLLGQKLPQIGIVPIATSNFPAGSISKTANILLGKFGPPKDAAVQNLEEGRAILEELNPKELTEKPSVAVDKWEDKLRSLQDGTSDRLELSLSWDSPSKIQASLREDYMSVLKPSQYLQETMQSF